MATFWFFIISCILSKGLFGLLSPLCLHFIYINIIIYYPCLQFVSSVLTVNCGACSSRAVTAIWGQTPVAAGMVALTSLYPTTFPSSSLGPWWSPGFLKPHQIWQNQQNHIFSKEQRCDSEVTKPKLESSQLRHLLRLTAEELLYFRDILPSSTEDVVVVSKGSQSWVIWQISRTCSDDMIASLC